MLNEKLFYDGGQNLLIYQKEDWNSDFGIRVLSEVFINSNTENPVKLAESLHARFPQETFYRLPVDNAYSQAYVPFCDAPTVDSGKILLDQTSPEENFIHESNFPFFSYFVDLEARQLHSVRGNDRLHDPADRVYETFSENQKAFLKRTMDSCRPSLFPYKVEHSYAFDALPSLYKFESDLANSSKRFLDDLNKQGL